MYAKVFAQIFDSSIAENYEVRHVFEDLLKLADKEGVVDMTMEAIHRRTNVPLEKVRFGIEELMKPDASSRSKEREGRRLVPLDSRRDWGWIIVNYQHYRDIVDEEARKSYFRDAKKRQREKGGKSGGSGTKRGGGGFSRASIDAASRAYEKAEGDGASAAELDKIVESTLPKYAKDNTDNGGRVDGMADTVRAGGGVLEGVPGGESLPCASGSDVGKGECVSESDGGRAGMGVADEVIFCDRCKEPGHIANDCVGHYESGVWVKD